MGRMKDFFLEVVEDIATLENIDLGNLSPEEEESLFERAVMKGEEVLRELSKENRGTYCSDSEHKLKEEERG